MNKDHAPYVAAAAGAAVAILVFAVALVALDQARRADLAFELAKAAIGVLPLAFFGVIVADLVRRRDTSQALRREKEADNQVKAERRDAYRRAFRAEVIAAYNELKGARRILRGAGLAAPWRVELDDDKLLVLDTQLHGLIRTQLTLECLKREMRAPTSFDSRADIEGHLETLDGYANAVIKEWEPGRAQLTTGGPSAKLSDWPCYRAFTGGQDDGGDFSTAVSAMKEIERLVIGELGEGMASGGH